MLGQRCRLGAHSSIVASWLPELGLPSDPAEGVPGPGVYWELGNAPAAELVSQPAV